MQSSGFVLLQALWLLLLASLLASIVMALSLSNARDGATAIDVSRTEIAAESAVHKILYEILVGGHRSVWLRASHTAVLEIDGAEVSVTVCDINGLVDVNASDESTLRRLTAALSVPDVNRMIASIKAARPMTNYVALRALDSISSDVFESIFPHITLFSRQSAPSTDKASAWLVSALHLEKISQGALVDSGAIAGRVLRVTAIARRKEISSQSLNAEIRITGRRDQPFLIYDWSWQAAPAQ